MDYKFTLTATNANGQSVTATYEVADTYVSLFQAGAPPPGDSATLSISETDETDDNPKQDLGDVVAGNPANFLATAGSTRTGIVYALYTAQDGSATADKDYTQIDSGNNPIRGPQLVEISLPSGSQSIAIPTFADPREISPTNFEVDISNPGNGIRYLHVLLYRPRRPPSCTQCSPPTAETIALPARPTAPPRRYPFKTRSRASSLPFRRWIHPVRETRTSGSHFVPLDMSLEGFAGSPG